METKICGKCKEEKPVSEFSKNSSSKDGLQCYCKKCQAVVTKEWQNNNREHVKALARQWNAKNPEKCRAKEKRWKDSHQEQYKNRMKKWRDLNADRLKEKQREYYQNNNEKIREMAKKWYKKNTLQSLLNNRISTAKRNNLIYDDRDILYEYLKPIYELGVCECCGQQFQHGNKNIQDTSLSIDQIIPNNGYTVDNVALLCGRCNRIKNNGTWQEHLLISNWQREKEISMSENNPTITEQESVVNL